MKNIFLLVCVLTIPCLSASSGLRDQGPSTTSPGAQAPSSNPPASPAASAANGDFAHLHVYRQHRYQGSALAPSIAIDGTQVARVGSGRRVTIKLKPGSRSISSDDKSSAITLDVKGGQDYYIRIDEEIGFWKGHGRLTLIQPEQGSPEYKLQKPIEPDRVFQKEMIEDDK
jgi:Protein of unknown function (DUF2846)